jgi:hypothetical protein
MLMTLLEDEKVMRLLLRTTIRCCRWKIVAVQGEWRALPFMQWQDVCVAWETKRGFTRGKPLNHNS